MKLMKFIQFMFVVTLVAMIYVHMQMRIFSLAYEGKKREQKITQLKENNGAVAYDILELKSASHLGRKVLKQDRTLKFYDQTSVVRLKTDRLEDPQAQQLAVSEKTNPLLKLLSFRAQAEARAAEHRPLKPWYR
ncbi:MAG TPA: hypothetical protein P5246_08480 [Candidatus Omnitrophota bacterium]|jgi:hypothetical protein|nr:hypothetical protein [Candidatus Omnitrophota bacterium]HSA31093.1 hypothetical protein [Candidatus Omnitrophota bacterium]